MISPTMIKKLGDSTKNMAGEMMLLSEIFSTGCSEKLLWKPLPTGSSFCVSPTFSVFVLHMVFRLFVASGVHHFDRTRFHLPYLGKMVRVRAATEWYIL